MNIEKYKSVLVPKKYLFYSEVIMDKPIYYFILPVVSDDKETRFFIRPDWLVSEEEDCYKISFLEDEVISIFKRTDYVSSKDCQNSMKFEIIKEAYTDA